MSFRAINGNQSLLRIYIDEQVKYQSDPLWKVLIKRAREDHLAGCTVVRSLEGFGPHHGYKTELIFDGAGEFTMVLEIIDSEEKINEFVQKIESILADSLVVRKKVYVRYYSHESNGNSVPNSEEATTMTTELNGKQTLLRIFVGESDKVGLHPLYLEVLKQARKAGLAGGTVLKGISGFGANSIIHEPHLFRISSDLPVIIEVIDSEDKIDKFMDIIEPQLKGALVTEEEVSVRHYKAK
jgi:PII-like signaling protein